MHFYNWSWHDSPLPKSADNGGVDVHVCGLDVGLRQSIHTIAKK